MLTRHFLAATALAAAAMIPAPGAYAGSTGTNPATCGSGATWAYKDFNLAGRTFREELRHAYGCGGVGWGRLTAIAGTGPAFDVIQSAWNPGQASQGGVPGTNYTYTVDASAGKQVCAGFQAYKVDNFGRRTYYGWYFAGCYTA